jgi:hypothetical protein
MTIMRIATLALLGWLAGCSGGAMAPDSPGTGGESSAEGGSSGSPGTGGTAACPSSGAPKTVRIYVAGESIEERNRFVAPPFDCDGHLNERGGGADRNANDEYGWMVPLAARLGLRRPGLTVEFVGASVWTGSDGDPYSGTFPSAAPARTSAIAGTDIVTWLDEGSRDRGFPPRRKELQDKTHCYDVAFAARGGNDLNQEVSDKDYKAHLGELVRLLLAGSSCRADPLVVVTAHMPDRADVAAQDRLFQRLSREVVDEVKASLGAAQRDRVVHVDVYGAFKANRATTALGAPRWFVGGKFDLALIGREGDTLHPRRLASIYAGEVVADALDLAALEK